MGAVVIQLLGGWDAALKAFYFIIVTDFILGTYQAFRTRTFNSSTGRAGIGKIFLYHLTVALAFHLDKIVEVGFREFTIMIICLTELKSIFENMEELGMKVSPDIIEKIMDFKNGKD